MYACMHARMHACMYVYVCMYCETERRSRNMEQRNTPSPHLSIMLELITKLVK